MNTQRQETEVVTGRKKVGENKGEIALKLKPTGEDTEPWLEEEEPPPINKIDKDKKKVNKGKGRVRIRKTQSKRKGESEMRPIVDYQETTLTKAPKSWRVDHWSEKLQSATMIAVLIKQENA